MSPGAKLTIGALVASAAIAYVALVGAVDGWQYYLSVDEAVFDAARLTGKRLRVSGLVAEGSLVVAEDRRAATFELAARCTLCQSRLSVHCRTILLRELT
jgi:cytochrome c-type biogenesis protein CcmE